MLFEDVLCGGVSVSRREQSQALFLLVQLYKHGQCWQQYWDPSERCPPTNTSAWCWWVSTPIPYWATGSQARHQLLPLIGILLLKRIMAPVPTRAFLVSSLQLHLLVDFVKEQDRSMGSASSLPTIAFWCVKIWMGSCQHCRHRTWVRHLHVSGACRRSQLHWSVTHPLTWLFPAAVRGTQVACLSSPCYKQGPGTDPFAIFA